jgi:hypothetical protein
VRLRDAKQGDEDKVFALKILRKVDGTQSGAVSVVKHR